MTRDVGADREPNGKELLGVRVGDGNEKVAEEYFEGERYGYPSQWHQLLKTSKLLVLWHM
jgi:hypothetical protein